MKKTIYPCLWFNRNAAEAARFYCSIFKDSHIVDENPFVTTFVASGELFMCLNGGPEFPINPSISFFVVCDRVEEVDHYWRTLTEGGMEMMPLDKYPWSDRYAFIQDKFGVSWQLSYGKMEDVGQRFTPTLMFTESKAGQAEEAIGFYTSVFNPSSVVGIARYGAGEGDKEGTVKHAQFTLGDTVMMAMDSSITHGFEFSEGVSLVVECDTQEQIDHYWSRLAEGGRVDRCGWLKDQFGVSWQIVPSILSQLLADPERSQQVTEAFMKMTKFDIQKLLEA
jgi:predicted 3-demethylubiquinone-9 3-methyltransferase (glyoxalase superfamily)